MCLKRACDLFLFRFAELSSLGADDAPLHHQIIQNLFQLWALIFFHTEDDRQFLDFHRDIHIIAHKVIYHFFRCSYFASIPRSSPYIMKKLPM